MATNGNQTCLEKRGMSERNDEILRNDYNKENEYSSTHENRNYTENINNDEQGGVLNDSNRVDRGMVEGVS